MTPETKKKISDIRKKQGSPWLKGHQVSASTRAKIGASNKGRKSWNKGKKASPELRKKIKEASLRGADHPKWKGGGCKSSNGYTWVYAPEHPLAKGKAYEGYVLEHRMVMCEKIGRVIKREEIVHHINGVRDDNRPENLMLTTSSSHVSTHNKERVWREESKEKARKQSKKRGRNKVGQFVGNKKELLETC